MKQNHSMAAAALLLALTGLTACQGGAPGEEAAKPPQTQEAEAAQDKTEKTPQDDAALTPGEAAEAAQDGAGQEQTVLTECAIGEEDGYGYELWKDEGDTVMTLTGDGTFTCEWKNGNSCLFRRGKKFDCTQTYQEMGDIRFTYQADYQPAGNSYLCVYGWTRDPLIEYYIVDSWGSWRPPGSEPVGTVTADGGVYDVYRTVREEQPSIDGTATFEQYWSVRQEKRSEGVIHTAEHFAAWEKLGMKLGRLYEAALTVEGYQSAGKAAILKNEMTIESPGEAAGD